jgi:hypothetical protein
MDFDFDKLERVESILDALGDFDGAEEGRVFSSMAGVLANPEYWGDDEAFSSMLDFTRDKVQRYMDGIIANGYADELSELLEGSDLDPVSSSEDVQRLLSVFNA